MKKSILTTIVAAGFALGAFAQGSVNVADNQINPGVTINNSSTFYSGAMTLQVWYMNGSTIAGNINGNANNVAYANMVADGFTLAQTYTSASISSGTFTFGELDIAGVSPAAANTEFALVAMNNNTFGSGSTAWATGVASGPTFRGGLVAFENPTANYATPPPNTPTPPNFTGWNTLGQNLVMTAVATPEPTTIAFAALGLGSFLVARRRK